MGIFLYEQLVFAPLDSERSKKHKATTKTETFCADRKSKQAISLIPIRTKDHRHHHRDTIATALVIQQSLFIQQTCRWLNHEFSASSVF